MKESSHPGGERAHAARHEGRDTIKDLVLQEAAAAIMAAGRELTEVASPERLSVRDFLRGPVLKVGIALSVMGVTMWVAQLNAGHQRRRQAKTRSASRPRPARRQRRSAAASSPST